MTPLGFAAGWRTSRRDSSFYCRPENRFLADCRGWGQKGALVPEASLFLTRKHSSVPQNSNLTFKTCHRHRCLLLLFTNFLFQTHSIIFPLLPLLNKKDFIVGHCTRFGGGSNFPNLPTYHSASYLWGSIIQGA